VRGAPPEPGKTVFLELADDIGLSVEGHPEPLQEVVIYPDAQGTTLVGCTPATPPDRADAEQVLALRAMLLSDEHVRGRLVALRPLRADSDALRAEARLLSEQIDGLLTPRAIEQAVIQLDRQGGPRPSVVAHTGSGRRNSRKRSNETLELVVASLKWRAAGLSANRADDAASEPDRFRNSVRAARKRVRDDAARIRPE
jgi:hypothetical protein